MKITDQSQTNDVLVTFVEDNDGAFYIHWLSLVGGTAMVFIGVSDVPECNRIHKFVLDSMPIRSDVNLGVPAQGASFTVN